MSRRPFRLLRVWRYRAADAMMRSIAFDAVFLDPDFMAWLARWLGMPKW